MKYSGWILLGLLLLPSVAAAKQARCPLPLDTCIVQFGHMRERPWLGVYVEADSLGRRLVGRVVPGGPAQKAGIRPGDVLLQLNGRAPGEFFATRAGWKTGDPLPVVVRRGARDHALVMVATPVPEEWFARIVGEHMLEAHLAYMDTGEPEHSHRH